MADKPKGNTPVGASLVAGPGGLSIQLPPIPVSAMTNAVGGGSPPKTTIGGTHPLPGGPPSQGVRPGDVVPAPPLPNITPAPAPPYVPSPSAPSTPITVPPALTTALQGIRFPDGTSIPEFAANPWANIGFRTLMSFGKKPDDDRGNPPIQPPPPPPVVNPPVGPPGTGPWVQPPVPWKSPVGNSQGRIDFVPPWAVDPNSFKNEKPGFSYQLNPTPYEPAPRPGWVYTGRTGIVQWDPNTGKPLPPGMTAPPITAPTPGPPGSNPGDPPPLPINNPPIPGDNRPPDAP